VCLRNNLIYYWMKLYKEKLIYKVGVCDKIKNILEIYEKFSDIYSKTKRVVNIVKFYINRLNIIALHKGSNNKENILEMWINFMVSQTIKEKQVCN